MPFNSIVFILFLVVAIAVRYGHISWSVRMTILTFLSYVFYSAWNPPFVLLLLLTTFVDHTVARSIAGSSDPHHRKAYLAISAVINFSLLFFFKYADLFVTTAFTMLLADLPNWVLGLRKIVLPVGISFYTFQSFSYVVDVYRGREQPATSLQEYMLYVSFFPQLVAGPIVRSKILLPQLREERPFDAALVGRGAFMLVVGLFQKAVLADDVFAPAVEKIFDAAGPVTFLNAWTGAIAFSMQIYCDFAGYSNCAIGSAMCMGFRLPENFAAPYSAKGFSDFWSRWHISLSSWLRDYLYIPLGGNRHGRWSILRNLMITMLLGGLWHGAQWTFVAWGAIHGVYLVLERFIRYAVTTRPGLRSILRPLAPPVTFILVCVAWVFFRCHEFDQAFRFVEAMFSPSGGWAKPLVGNVKFLEIMLVSLTILVYQHRNRNISLADVYRSLAPFPRVVFMAFMLLAVIAMSGDDRAFIYFQF